MIKENEMSDTAAKLDMRWDLDSIFPGGSGSAKYKEFRDKLKQDLAAASMSFATLPDKLEDSSREQYKIAILEFQRLSENLGLAYSLAECLTAQDVDDKPALQILQEIDVFVSEWRNLETRLESLARKQDDASWSALLEDSSLSTVKFFLIELRDNAKHWLVTSGSSSPKMARQRQSLSVSLRVRWTAPIGLSVSRHSVSLRKPGRLAAIMLRCASIHSAGSVCRSTNTAIGNHRCMSRW